MKQRLRIHITGIVQGVGMRPFVYREAVFLRLAGWVRNSGDGVHIEAQGEAETLHRFVEALQSKAPDAARVDHMLIEEAPVEAAQNNTEFKIISSDKNSKRTTLVSPDIATCHSCLKELFDPSDRRYHYPFINCTNCGPRFTIIRELPYDRAKTSMDNFPMCPACAAEYSDPTNRRFHAQPNACFECGPHLIWSEYTAISHGCTNNSNNVQGSQELRNSTYQEGKTRTQSDAIIERCAELIVDGGIVAIKGLGGFHLVCNPKNEVSVKELRRRKRRSNKPLALMVRNLETAKALCNVSPDEERILTGTTRPIVLLRRHADSEKTALARSVAYTLPELGIMLPYTPLHHLLFAKLAAYGIDALVMTSGNVSEEPIEMDDNQAWKHLVLGGLADAILGNNRVILERFDDSVVRVVDGVLRPVRRARGYAPQPLMLPTYPTQDHPIPCILACGPEQKATLAYTRKTTQDTVECLLSQHIGNIEHAETFDAWHKIRLHLQELFDVAPQVLACDAHPSYLSSQWARAESTRAGIPLIEVQHHHAHIASVLAEALAENVQAQNEFVSTKTVLGIALDGTGAGTDGTIWGGELLLANLSSYIRIGHLATWPLPGGAAAVRDARRNAYGLLCATNLLAHPGAASLLQSLSTQTPILNTMVEHNLNTPLTSSMGRLLDACSALINICPQATYEGEPAVLLEAAAWHYINSISSDPHAFLKKILDQPPRYHFDLYSEPNVRINDETKRNQNLVGEVPAPEQLILDSKPLIEMLLDDYAAQRSQEAIALDIHLAVAQSLAHAITYIAQRNGVTTVTLSGGVLLNRILLTALLQLVENQGFKVLVPYTIPVNDGCIAYGQAAVAYARLYKKYTEQHNPACA